MSETDDLIIDHEEAWQQRQQALGPLDYVIELTFLSFEVEDENDCAFDFVEVRISHINLWLITKYNLCI